VIWIFLLFAAAPMQEQLLEAHALYESGELNGALEHYREVAQHAVCEELFYNLGACCVGLDEMAWAVYYFIKGGSEAEANIARAELGLDPLPRSLRAGPNSLALPMALLCALLLLLGSWAIWSKRRSLRRWTLSLLLLTGLLYAGMVWSHLFAPVQGVVVRSSAVRSSDGAERIAIAPAGSLIKVIQGGDQLLVVTEKGERGYLSSDVVQLLVRSKERQ